jgi:hypothetical protein
MTEINFDLSILGPVLIVVALTFASGFHLLRLRITAVKTGVMKLSFYRTHRSGEEPERIAAATRHYANLFETPMLLYLGCAVAGILGPASIATLAAAWVFAILRVIQSLIHLTNNNVKWRAYAFTASWLALLILWASILTTLIIRP